LKVLTMSYDRASELRAGAVAILPAAIAVIPVGLLLGARAAEKGLSIAEVLLMSATVFAGSAQFVVIDLWTDPASWLFIALTTLLVNIRHVLMGASLAGKLDAFAGVAKPAAASFLADESWAMAERRAREVPLTPAYFVGLAGPLYVNWVFWSVCGAAFGGAIKDPETFGFDFAFTAIFIGILTGFWRSAATAWVLAASSAAAVSVCLVVDGPWYILAGGLAGVVVAVVFWRPVPEIEEEGA
jgi:4-azaleucine resistance transporter AzlC